ncbi:MAG TPA: phage major capsid protein, partial [Clostridiaceae bacterium]|nr:phage major capsid protein [Clostridiaceae bacterium]
MKNVKRVMEFRALPALEEKRNVLVEEMETILKKTKEETRAFSDEEQTRFDAIKKEIESIDKTILADDEMRGFETKKSAKKSTEEEKRALDEKNFLDYIRTGQIRALGVTDNGAAIIPTEIAKSIVEKVKELSPIYQMATKFNVSGDLQFPVEDTATGKITAAYVDDLTELIEGTGKFTSIKLQNHIVGALAKISKSLINRSGFDLLAYAVRKIAEAIAEFLEKELITGNAGKMKGLITTTNTT